MIGLLDEYAEFSGMYQLLESTWLNYTPPEYTAFIQNVEKAETAWERIVERQVRARFVSPRVKAMQLERLGLADLYNDARHAYSKGEVYSGKWDGSGDYIFRNIEERTWL